MTQAAALLAPAAETDTDDATAAARPFLDGQLVPMTGEAVAEIYAQFRARIDGLVDAAMTLAQCDCAQTRMAAADYAHACSRTRFKLTAKGLAEDIEGGLDNLQYLTVQRLEAQDALEHQLKNYMARQKKLAPPISFIARIKSRMFTFNTRAEKKPATPLDALPWNDQGRIYFQLDDNSTSPAEAVITAYLAERGYTVTDYAAGRARDNRRNEWKIGKLLKDNPGLLEAYYDDPTLQSKNLMVVVTRNIDDLARGSYQRAWQSCRASAEAAARHATAESEAGVMSAYLVSKNDPDIHNPLARINIKPYDLQTRHADYTTTVDAKTTIYAPFTPIGLHHAGFADAVERWTEKTMNAGKPSGTYRLRRDCESYKEFSARRRLPMDGVAALQELGIAFFRNNAGEVVVPGSLSLRGMGLTRLPDFSAITVKGDIDVSENKLLTLEGLPTKFNVGLLKADENLLVCFAGAEGGRATEFSYRNNAWLMTGHGAPKADVYYYGNKQRRHYAEGRTCVTPVEKPEHFPRFKRK